MPVRADRGRPGEHAARLEGFIRTGANRNSIGPRVSGPLRARTTAKEIHVRRRPDNVTNTNNCLLLLGLGAPKHSRKEIARRVYIGPSDFGGCGHLNGINALFRRRSDRQCHRLSRSAWADKSPVKLLSVAALDTALNMDAKKKQREKGRTGEGRGATDGTETIEKSPALCPCPSEINRRTTHAAREPALSDLARSSGSAHLGPGGGRQEPVRRRRPAQLVPVARKPKRKKHIKTRTSEQNSHGQQHKGANARRTRTSEHNSHGQHHNGVKKPRPTRVEATTFSPEKHAHKVSRQSWPRGAGSRAYEDTRQREERQLLFLEPPAGTRIPQNPKEHPHQRKKQCPLASAFLPRARPEQSAGAAPQKGPFHAPHPPATNTPRYPRHILNTK